MGLDWIVQVFKKNTYEVVEESDRTQDDYFQGTSFVRSKYIVWLLNEYGAGDDLRKHCYGEETYNDGFEVGTFVCPSILISIGEFMDKVELIENESLGTIEEQETHINDINCMANDVLEFNAESEDFEARIMAWY